MAITYNPKVGEVLECNYGDHATTEDFDGHIPPEMRKKRMVVILNGKLGGACLVVPISSKKDLGSIGRGYHVELDTSYFRITDFYDRRERWAKADTVEHVSKKRLFKMRDGNQRFDQYLPREVVELIQRAVIKALSAQTLLKGRESC